MRSFSKSVLVLAAIVSAPMVAQPPAERGPDPDVLAKSTDVFVQMKGGASNRRISVGPRAVAVCKEATPTCDNQITWKWLPSNVKSGESILVKFDSPDAANCFDHTTLPIPLTNGTVTATVNDEDTCHYKTAWFYTVSCIDAAGKQCDGVAPVDPGVIIDGKG